MSAPHRLADRRDARREVGRAARRRRRGGEGRGPVVVQRVARRIAAALLAVRRGVLRLVRGDRPLAAALAGSLVLAVVLLSGPAQSYLDQRARVEALTVKAAALEAENERLGRRAADLEDPDTIELIAREQQGFIRPGEVPYTLAPPEVERPRITAPRGDPEPAPGPWYERAWSLVRDWLG